MKLVKKNNETLIKVTLKLLLFIRYTCKYAEERKEKSL